MNQILAMREKRANLWDAAKKYRDAHIGEDGTMSAEDAATYDRMVEDVDRMKAEVERLERQQAIDAELNQPTARPLAGKPLQPGAEENSERQMHPERLKQTFLHELLHGAIWECGIKSDDEEMLVKTMARGLLQIINDNPEIFAN